MSPYFVNSQLALRRLWRIGFALRSRVLNLGGKWPHSPVPKEKALTIPPRMIIRLQARTIPATNLEVAMHPHSSAGTCQAIRLWSSAILLVLLLIASTPRPASGATTITVSIARGTDSSSCGAVTSPCKTIRYALVQRASNGDTISVEAGTYPESLNVTKSVTITGVPGALTPVAIREIPGGTRPIPFPVQPATIIVGVGTTRVFTVQRDIGLVINNVVIHEAKSTADGAAI